MLQLPLPVVAVAVLVENAVNIADGEVGNEHEEIPENDAEAPAPAIIVGAEMENEHEAIPENDAEAPAPAIIVGARC